MKVNFNKETFINLMATRNETTKVQAEKELNNVIVALKDALGKIENAGEGKLVLVNTLSIELVNKGARIGRNPRTKEVVNIPARKAFKISLGKGLKI